jgi:hypothetical protein
MAAVVIAVGAAVSLGPFDTLLGDTVTDTISIQVSFLSYGCLLEP